MRTATIERARRVQDMVNSGKTIVEACDKVGLSTLTYRKWREEQPQMPNPIETKANESTFDDFAFARLTRNILKLSISAEEKLELIEQLSN